MDEDEERKAAAWYDALSRGYDELYGPEQSLKEKLVLDFIARKRFSLLVDVGCGSATLLRDAADLYDFGIGVDLSLRMLNEAKKKTTANNDLIRATSRMLPLRNGCIDCAVSVSTLKTGTNLQPTLDELVRICNKFGTLALSIFGSPRDDLPTLSSGLIRSTRISDRESLYFVEIEKTDGKKHDKSGTLG